MGKLIDAERFKNEDLAFSGGHISDDLKLYVEYAEVVKAIEKAPAVDAVEVVRCKDCKWYNPKDNDPFWCDCDDGLWNASPESYCSRGERREPPCGSP